MVTATIQLTEKEKDLAERILERAKRYTGNFYEKYGQAAQDLGYDNYGEVPTRVKQFISQRGGKTRKWRTR